MRRAGLPLFALAACNPLFGLDPVGGRDGGDDPPIDATDALAIDGPDGGPDDPDGDGVPTATDNCPQVGNPQQDDEDADGIGNRCDPCPYLIGDGESNLDQDGVGDLCDFD